MIGLNRLREGDEYYKYCIYLFLDFVTARPRLLLLKSLLVFLFKTTVNVKS